MEHSKDDFPVTARTGFFLLSLAVVSMPVSGLCQRWHERVFVDLKNNTVAVEAHHQSGPEWGFGFIVALVDSSAYVVTANHLVRDTSDYDRDADSVVVRYAVASDDRHPAELLPQYHRELDIAVVKAPVPEGLDWRRKCIAQRKKVMRGVAVAFIGEKQTWWVPPQPGLIEDIDSTRNRLEFRDVDVLEGSSGAPLIIKQGIAGMVLTGATGEYNEAVPVWLIRSALEDWQYPWECKGYKGRPWWQYALGIGVGVGAVVYVLCKTHVICPEDEPEETEYPEFPPPP